VDFLNTRRFALSYLGDDPKKPSAGIGLRLEGAILIHSAIRVNSWCILLGPGSSKWKSRLMSLLGQSTSLLYASAAHQEAP